MRIRTVKPEFFVHADLADLEFECKLPVRLAFIGLWCAADRDGRFGWNARRLGVQILPYDDVDFGAILDALHANGYIEKYEVEGKTYGCIPSFNRHQVINNREQESTIPPNGETHGSLLTLDSPKTGSLDLKFKPDTSRTTLPFDSVEFAEAWDRWTTHRAEKKKKLTPTTSEMQLKKLKGVGEARAIRMIDYSIENGWMGLFEDQSSIPIPEQRKPQTSDQFSI